MNKSINPVTTPVDLSDAAELFSQSLVTHMTSKGHHFLEKGGEGAYLFDNNGKRYIDCYMSAGAFNLGRRNPELLGELNRVSRDVDQGVFIMISEQKVLAATALAEFCPGNLECSLLQVVRGEAFDAACKLARGYTKRKELISVDGGWYGQTGFATSLSGRVDKDRFGELIPETTIIAFNDQSAAIKAITSNTAAVVIETVQAENGCRVAADDYMNVVQKACREKGALLIVDETQTGFGRTGAKFSFQRYQGIQPDIVIIGESAAGGVFPLSGMIYNAEIKTFFDEHPMIHLNTFGGHDVGCLMLVKSIELYDRLKPWNNAAKKGERLLEELKGLMSLYPDLIRSVNGSGLLLAMEFPNTDIADSFCRISAEKDLFVEPGEVAGHSIPLRPSLLIDDTELDEIVHSISAAIKTLAETTNR